MQSYVICGYVKGTEKEMARDISRIRRIIKNVYSRRNRMEIGTREREKKMWGVVVCWIILSLSRWIGCQLSQEIFHVFFCTVVVSLVHVLLDCVWFQQLVQLREKCSLHVYLYYHLSSNTSDNIDCIITVLNHWFDSQIKDNVLFCGDNITYE